MMELLLETSFQIVLVLRQSIILQDLKISRSLNRKLKGYELRETLF
nr:MAG TPA: hypothetical protein [Bacteriophage sp.]